MYQIKVTRPGSLESVLIDQPVSPAQVSIVTAILKDSTLTYGEVLAFLSLRRVKDLDAPGVLTALASVSRTPTWVEDNNPLINRG